jgi:hypothetical protein
MTHFISQQISRWAVAALMVAISVPAQAQLHNNPGSNELIPREQGHETYLFRSLLKFTGLEAINIVPWQGRIDDIVLVLIGSIQPEDAIHSTRVLLAGGSVLIATDQTAILSSFFPTFRGPVVTGRSVEIRNTEVNSTYLGVSTRPYLVPSKQEFINPDLVRMTRLKRVVADSPSSFQFVKGGYVDVPVAYYPRGPVHLGRPRMMLEDDAPLVLMNDAERDRNRAVAVVVANRGLFTNRMLLARGTDNLAYVYHLSRYLTTGPTGDRRRTRCLFIENGEVKTDFDRLPLSEAQLPEPPPPPMPSLGQLQDKITDAVNQAVNELQTRDMLGQAVANRYESLARILVLAAAALVVLVLIWRVWLARHQPEFTIPTTTTNPEDSLLDLRRQDILSANNVYEPLREYLRGLFAEWGQPTGGPELPPIEVMDRMANQRHLVHKLRKLWEIAYGDTPMTIPFVRWKELEPMMDFVIRAAEAGRWRFAQHGGVE